jgi:hypothetical protein
MKKKGVRIFIILLILIQAGLAIKLFYIDKNLISKSNIIHSTQFDLLFLGAFLCITFCLSVLLVISLFAKSSDKQKVNVDLISKIEIRDKKEQKQLKEDEKQRLQMQAEKKRLLLNDLMKDLSIQLNIQNYCEKVLINLSKQYEVMQGLFFLKDQNDKIYRRAGSYAFYNEDELREFTEDIGLSGQVAANKKLLNISNIPEKYITIHSGLGKSSPTNLIIFPILNNNEAIGIIELASFIKFDAFSEEVLMALSMQIGSQLAEIRLKNLGLEKVKP